MCTSRGREPQTKRMCAGPSEILTDGIRVELSIPGWISGELQVTRAVQTDIGTRERVCACVCTRVRARLHV